MENIKGFASLNQYIALGAALSNEYLNFVDTGVEKDLDSVIDEMELQDISLENKMRILFALRHSRPMFRTQLRSEAKRIINMERVLLEAKLADIQGMCDGERIVTGVNMHTITPAEAMILSLGDPEIVYFVIGQIDRPENSESILLAANFISDVIN